MSRPTFEILKVVATDDYIADASVIKEAGGVLQKAPGYLGSWRGLEIQDPKHLWIVVAWESHEHHLAFQRDEQQHPTLLASLRKAAKERIFMYHAKFSGDLYKTLDAGVTGFAIWTLEESADRAQFHETLAKVVAQSSTSESDGVFVGGFAEVIEDQRKFFVAIGWENMERFQAAFAANAAQVEAQHAALKQIGADIDLKLVKLTKS